MKKKDKKEMARKHFFDNCVEHPNVKRTMSGKNEKFVIEFLEKIGFRLGKDFVRQHPIGDRFVIDIAFVKEQVALEVDGASHLEKKQIKKDNMRDKFLHRNGWLSIRINDKDFFSDKMQMYRYVIEDVVLERRSQYEKGELYEIDIPDFDENLYN